MNDMGSSLRQDERVDVRALLAQLRRRGWWIAVGVVLSTALFTAAAILIQPVFRAAAVVIPVSSERNSLAGSLTSSIGQLGGGLASLAGLNIGSTDSATTEALGVLRSRQFNEKFIIDEDLMPQLFAYAWDPKAYTWKPEIKSVPTVGRAFKRFNGGIRKVLQDNKTGLITLQIDWGDRNAAAQWANELVKRVNAEMRKRAISNADASLAFLEKELTTTSVVETREAINRLIETQEKQKMLANVTEEYAFRVVDPAIAPDADDPVRPPKFLLLIAGPLLGFALSVACILVFGSGSIVAPGDQRS